MGLEGDSAGEDVVSDTLHSDDDRITFFCRSMAWHLCLALMGLEGIDDKHGPTCVKFSISSYIIQFAARRAATVPLVARGV